MPHCGRVPSVLVDLWDTKSAEQGDIKWAKVSDRPF